MIDNVTANRIFKIAESLDNSAREVSFRATRHAAGISISRTELAMYFKNLKRDTAALEKAMERK